jgi:hypothetical protein
LEIAMTTPVRAALYLRVSAGRQADSDLSIPDQRRQAKAYCASRGYGGGYLPRLDQLKHIRFWSDLVERV